MIDTEKQGLATKKVAELQAMAGKIGVVSKGLKKADLIDAITKSKANSVNGVAPAKAPSRAPAPARASAPASASPSSAPPSAAPPSAAPSSAINVPRVDSRPPPMQSEPRRDFDQPRRDGFNRERDRGRRRRRGRERGPERFDRPPREPEVYDEADLEPATGILDILSEGYGFLRTTGYLLDREDVYVSVNQVKKFHLRRGDEVLGQARKPKESDKEVYRALVQIDTVNGKTPEEMAKRPVFEKLTPLYPEERIRLELNDDPGQITQRIIDLVAPIGKGQRGMIVSPPKAGKTTVMKQIAKSVRTNAPECHLIVLLVDERPEEVTDMQRSVDGEVIYSTFDRPTGDHIQVAELALDRAKRMVELGRDVVILLDGITRLSRAYNLAAPASGRILSGGIDSAALHPPRRFFAAARNIEFGGSLTILATALVETGSKMDEVIFEEFKGTGNWELRLDRRASEKRIFPAIDIEASGTRKEELLLTKEELALVWKLRRVLHALEGVAGLELLVDKMRATKGNMQFLMDVGRQGGGD